MESGREIFGEIPPESPRPLYVFTPHNLSSEQVHNPTVEPHKEQLMDLAGLPLVVWEVHTIQESSQEGPMTRVLAEIRVRDIVFALQAAERISAYVTWQQYLDILTNLNAAYRSGGIAERTGPTLDFVVNNGDLIPIVEADDVQV